MTSGQTRSARVLGPAIRGAERPPAPPLVWDCTITGLIAAMEQTLLLNATYEPLRVVHWQKAITLLVPGEGRGHLGLRPGDSGRLVQHQAAVRHPAPPLHPVLSDGFDYVPFSRANIYARDNHSCQYCGDRFPPPQLTFDHVVPVAQGGRKDWENIVTCCITCNRRKGGRTPEQAGMRLVRRPRRPPALPHLTLSLGVHRTPDSWRDDSFWDLAWDES